MRCSIIHYQFNSIAQTDRSSRGEVLNLRLVLYPVGIPSVMNNSAQDRDKRRTSFDPIAA